MGASPSPAQVQAATRKALDVAVKLFGGERQPGGVVQFVRDGIAWQAYVRTIRASNGETALLYGLEVCNTASTFETLGDWRHCYEEASRRFGVTVTQEVESCSSR